jgi:hypothetical protein
MERLLTALLLLLCGQRALASVPASEKLAHDFLAERYDEVIKTAGPTLEAQLGGRVGMSSGHAALLRELGAHRYVLAGWQDGPRVRVPLEFERGRADLVFLWQGETLFEFSAESSRPRPGSGKPIAPALQYREADYVDPFRYTEELIPVGTRRFVLNVPVVPDGAPLVPVPGIVLLADWELPDQDGSVGPNKPVRNLALGLASRGLAVVRILPAPIPSEATAEGHLLAPSLVAWRLLEQRPEVDRSRLFVVAHGPAALVATLMTEDVPLRGIVLLSPQADNLPARRLARLEALDSADPRRIAQLQSLLNVGTEPLLPSDLVDGIPFSLWRSQEGIRPIEILARTGTHTLAIFGARDNLPGAAADRAAFQAADESTATLWVREAPSLNHWMMESDYNRPGHVDASVLQTIELFIDRTPQREQLLGE